MRSDTDAKGRRAPGRRGADGGRGEDGRGGASGSSGSGAAASPGVGAPGPTGAAAPTAGAATLTIEQLAAESGMSVRNIRSHQSRGLLPPPEVRARIGYYGPEHVARLALILDLQADGFNLAAIERLVNAPSGSAARLLGLRHALTEPFEAESPEVVTAAELTERYGEVSGKDIERIRKLKLLVPLGDDRFEVPSPALMKAADQVTELGISLHAALALVERVSRDCESISRAFVRLYIKELWEPFVQEGQPEEQWDEVVAAITALRSIASEALLAIFKQRMATEVETASAKLLERHVKSAR